ncbi:MAG TPA: hypothetical protein PKY77_05815 [Phycisphaerae bacterium]|nr:hypothetical protein [Phycisphaerae bacterium]HRY69039.1 hypothetical protein [Phycisphaerae bacterium]HSA25986.1 hypothetical protein [Phycisphaerae bacterium]
MGGLDYITRHGGWNGTPGSMPGHVRAVTRERYVSRPAKRTPIVRYRPVADLRALCDECDHAEIDGPSGRAVGCDLLTPAVGRSCTPCRGRWLAAIKKNIPPNGCPHAVPITSQAATSQDGGTE